jgi:hypothetical protein
LWKPLLLSKFNKRWRYKQQVEEGKDIDILYKLIRNPAVISQRKGRGPAQQAVSSTTQDLSHFELGRGRGRGRGKGKGRGRGRGRGTSRDRGKAIATPIEVESGSEISNSRVSEVSDHKMWVERAREKRKRVPSLKAIETAAAIAELAAAQAEREFWEM